MFNLCDILFIEGKGAYLHVITDTARIMTLLSFKEIEALLPSGQFVRIHKSYLIAINRIDSIERNVVRIGDMRMPVGKSYLKEFYQRLNRYLGSPKVFKLSRPLIPNVALENESL